VSPRIYTNHTAMTINGHYCIEASRLDTPSKVLSWVVHLSKKNWVDAELIEEFVLACNSEYGVHIVFSC